MTNKKINKKIFVETIVSYLVDYFSHLYIKHYATAI